MGFTKTTIMIIPNTAVIIIIAIILYTVSVWDPRLLKQYKHHLFQVSQSDTLTQKRKHKANNNKNEINFPKYINVTSFAESKNLFNKGSTKTYRENRLEKRTNETKRNENVSVFSFRCRKGRKKNPPSIKQRFLAIFWFWFCSFNFCVI